jgi:hypothetical protein
MADDNDSATLERSPSQRKLAALAERTGAYTAHMRLSDGEAASIWRVKRWERLSAENPAIRALSGRRPRSGNER